MAIKNRLLDIRLQLGYKFQKDFAEFLNINPHQYNRYEKNTSQPSIEVLYTISKKTNIKMEDIIYEVEEG